MFEKLTFNKQEDTFEKYLELKGRYLHKQIYDIILDAKGSVSYNELSSVIRYDKSLRNKLYEYLATFEEYLKAQIFEKYDVENCDKIYKGSKGKNELIKDVREKTNFDYSNLYFCFELELGPIIEFIKEKKMFYDNIINKMDIVRDLRNRVMHHNLITCGKSKTYDELNKNINEIREKILALKELLPTEYQKGFQDYINRLKCDCNLFKIVLE